MNKKSNENGYALLIVLFAIVFILVITAVFMRGTISNAKQEKTVDENNLVVVSAEAGVDFYKWDFSNFLDEAKLEDKLNRIVNSIPVDDYPIDYNKIIKENIVGEFAPLLDHHAKSYINQQIELFNGYDHQLKAVRTELEAEDKYEDKYRISLYGTVQGNLSRNVDRQVRPKNLDFVMVFDFPKGPKGENTDNPNGPGTSDDAPIYMPKLRTPKAPAQPALPQVIGKQVNNCTPSSNKIANQKCNIDSIHEAGYDINKSTIYMAGTLSSWGTVDIENSWMNIQKDFTPASFDVENTHLTVGGTITAYQAAKINKSYLQTGSLNNSGGTASVQNTQMTITNKLEFQAADTEDSIISANAYKAHGQADFNKTDLSIKTNYESGGATFENSRLDIGGKLDSGGGLFKVKNSSVRISGNAHTANGSDIENSSVHIDGYFLHTSKPLEADDSDIYVGGKVTATNGTDFEDVNMVVLGDYESSTRFKLDDTKLSIGGWLSLGNGGEMEDSLLIAKKITSSTTIDADDSIIIADYLKSDVMKLEDSKVCVRDLEVRSLSMDDSKIYYYGTSNKEGSKIYKLSFEDFKKKCGVTFSPDAPGAPDTGDWGPKPPALKKVTYE